MNKVVARNGVAFKILARPAPAKRLALGVRAPGGRSLEPAHVVRSECDGHARPIGQRFQQLKLSYATPPTPPCRTAALATSATPP
eukprot:5877335-Prymnesium_polylepis.1